MERHVNGVSTGFDYHGMQQAMLRRQMSFALLARNSGIAEKILRKIAKGFLPPTPTQRLAIASALEDGDE